MLKIIKHRINRIADLNTVQPEWGVEIDLRSDVSKPGSLHLSHDPWTKGDDFEAWLDVYHQKGIQGPLILNTKEDGLESRILGLLAARGIKNYFFLDTALPTLIRYAIREKNDNFALRLSAYERTETLNVFKGKAKWVWVDCFDGVPVSVDDIRSWKDHYQFCLVSPELQGKSSDLIPSFDALRSLANAVCTKFPEIWAR